MSWAPVRGHSKQTGRKLATKGAQLTDESGSEHERLRVLVGTWKTEGWTREAAGAPAVRIDAVDTYEWLTGRWEARGDDSSWRPWMDIKLTKQG
jgi:hypothetical protein